MNPGACILDAFGHKTLAILNLYFLAFESEEWGIEREVIVGRFDTVL